MTKGPKVDNEDLLRAGLGLMARAGKPLDRVPRTGKSMIYTMQNGENVRVRTCNDHILIALANSPDEGAKLNIEGTRWLLFVVPERERTPGPVKAWLLPTKMVVDEVRRSHAAWLADGATNSAGQNRTWNLWFREDGPAKARGYGKRWEKYLLPGNASTLDQEAVAAPASGNPLPGIIDAARRQIAAAAGVPAGSVKISIDFIGDGVAA
jgi:hypothetical protein